MYAGLFLENGPAPNALSSERRSSKVPYCFILDETYQVIMAGPHGGGDPLAPLYAIDAQPDTLPPVIDRIVRALTATWRSTQTARPASESLGELDVTVAPLHGFEGRRIAVYVRRGFHE